MISSSKSSAAATIFFLLSHDFPGAEKETVALFQYPILLS
jgi:hypothetical protein